MFADGPEEVRFRPIGVPAFDVVDADRTGWLARGAPRVHEIRSNWR
jgi:hypothetical protein